MGSMEIVTFARKLMFLICTVDEPSDVSDLISEVLNVYEESEDGESLFSTIIDNWNIFRERFTIFL